MFRFKKHFPTRQWKCILIRMNPWPIDSDFSLDEGLHTLNKKTGVVLLYIFRILLALKFITFKRNKSIRFYSYRN